MRVAQLVGDRGRVRAIRFAEQSLPADYRWEPGGDREPLVHAIRQAMEKAGIRTRTAIMAVPRGQATARISAFPPADRSDLERVVGYDLADHIPFPLDQVVVDWQPLGISRGEAGLTDVLVVAVQRDLVREHLRVAEDAGLRPAAVTIDALALDDLARRVPREPTGLTVTVAIGARASTINVSEGDRLRLTRSVGLGGQHLTRAIQEDLGLTVHEAEMQKETAGLGLLAQDPRPSRIAAWLENLLGEIRRSALSFGPAAVSSILLAGPEASLPGLKEAIHGEFGAEPIRLAAADLFPGARIQGDPREADSCLLAIAQGLQSTSGSAWQISLVPQEVQAAHRLRRLRRAGAVAAVLVMASMMTWYLLTAGGLSQRSKELAQLEEQAEAAAFQSADVEELRAERDRLRTRLSALETVRLRRHLALELLRSIALYAPDDIVLSHFRLRPDQALEIRGTAPTATVAADLQDALEGSPLVTQATLVGIDRTGAQRGQDAERVNFTIRATLWTQRKTPATAWTLARRGGVR